MAASTKGRICVAADGRQIVVRVEGRGAMAESQQLHDWLNRSGIEGRLLVIDLSRCDYLDSTFLGGLVKLHKQLSNRMMLAPAGQAQTLVQALGLHKLFHLEPQLPAVSCEWRSLDEAPTAAASPEHVYQCHRELADRDDPSSGIFRRVCQTLADDLKKK